MADYTSDEIQVAVEKVVRSSVRRNYGSLGNRDAQTTFNDLQDAAAGVFMLYPNAPFYAVYLGTERLAELVETEEEIVNQLIEAIDNLNRLTKEVENLAPLQNARVALQSLEGAATTRAQGFESIEDVPAFKRYDTNLQRFLDEYGKNIKRNEEIVPTPQQSRDAMATLISSLAESHATIVTDTGYLAGAIDDYDSMRLPALVSAGVISRARQVLSERIDELEALSAEDRLIKIREVTLDLLAGRAAVAGMGSLKATTMFANIEGTGSVYADSERPATVAKLTPDLAGPYPVVPTANSLYIKMDDSFEFTGLLPGSFLANITGGVVEPYDVQLGINDDMVITTHEPGVDTPYTIPLTVGAAQTAVDVANDINTVVVPGSIIEALPVIRTPRYIGTVAMVDVGGGGATFTLPAGAGNWNDYGVTGPGEFIQITVHTQGAVVGVWFSVTIVAGAALSAGVIGGAPPPPPSLTDPAAEIEIGQGRAVRIRIEASLLNQLDALNKRSGFSFPADPSQLAMDLLGFVERTEVYSLSTATGTVAEELTKGFNSQYQGEPRLSAISEFTSLETFLGRSDPNVPTRLVAFKLRDDAVLTTVSGADVTFDLTLSDLLVEVDDIVVIRETTTEGDVDVKGVVTAVSSTQIEATMDQAVTDGDVLVEVGPDVDLQVLLVDDDISLSKEYLDLRVTESTAQDGIYAMARNGQGTIPFEFTIDAPVPLNRAQGGLPEFFFIELGLRKATFASTDLTLSTKVEIDDEPPAAGPPNYTAHDKFFTGTAPFSAAGTTKYFQIPEDPKTLSIDDVLEFYITDYSSLDRTFDIEALELSQLLIEVTPEIETDFAGISMSISSPVPFAKIRLHKKNNYTILEDNLNTWLEFSANQEAWFTELYRLINPLLSDKNPTAADVGAAKAYVNEMLSALTALTLVLADYIVEPVEPLDTLVDTYLERGSERGVDILLSGRFSTFFNLSLEAMTYDGYMREAVRLVSREDLPVRKSGRATRIDVESIEGSLEDPNYEFDLSDVQDVDEIDIPGDYQELVSIGR